MTPTATTIVVARADFSIPGGEERAEALEPAALESRFFSLIADAKPDVVVLDLSGAEGDSTDAIVKVREQSGLPILVICGPARQYAREYRAAGAAECIAAPIDLVSFNQAVRHVLKGGGRLTAGPPVGEGEAPVLTFAGVSFDPAENVVASAAGRSARLTPAEGRLLAHFVGNPGEVQTRPVLAEVLYGAHRPGADRAVDAAVERLRAKLRLLGETTRFLIKTEFRGGYRFVANALVEQ